jgi:TolA-binding protein
VQLSGLRWVWVFRRRDFMSWNKTVLSALLTGIVLSAALAENATAQVPIRPRPSTVPGTTKPPRVEPCWEVAGVSKAAIQQRRMITQQARQQVEAVCANSSLSIQQKRQQIQQIRQRERQEIEGVITPAQQETMRSCQEGRNVGHGGGGHLGGGHGGPCGEMSLGRKPNPQHGEDETPPTETAKPN